MKADIKLQEMGILIKIKSMIKFKEHQISSYPARTEENVKLSDITLAFANNFFTAGEILTRNLCSKYNKIYVPINLNKKFYKEDFDKLVTIFDFQVHNYKINENSVIINIAGNGIYSLKWEQYIVDEMILRFFEEIFIKYNLITLNPKIISGGQTGIDEAGIKAAEKIGIECEILAPKNWMFRGKNGIDICNEELFKNRFSI